MKRAVAVSFGLGCAAAAALLWLSNPALVPEPALSGAGGACLDRVRSDGGHDGPLEIGAMSEEPLADGGGAMVHIDGSVRKGDEARDVAIRCLAMPEEAGWVVKEVSLTDQLR